MLHEAIEQKKFDTRMIERNVARSVISAEDADKVSKALPDDAENADYISIDSLAGDESGQKSAH